jgi:hypothetical protein
MSTTRYIYTYDSTGKLISQEPYTVPEWQLKREKAFELIQQLKQKGKDSWTLTDVINLIDAILIILKA